MSANPAASIDTARVLGHFINGVDVADTNRPAPVNDPATGAITKYVAMASSESVTGAIEAAVSVLRAHGLRDRIKVLADYFTHGVYRGIKRRRILAAPTDFPVLQGRLGIDQAVRLLEGRLTIRHAGPAIRLIDQYNVDEVGPTESLAPAWFKPTFTVE